MDLVFHNVVFLLARYVHIVCAAMLIGGTLFYEMVVPVAIEDLRHEQQLAIMGRARWIFRWIVWISAVLIILSGLIMAMRYWHFYQSDGVAVVQQSRPTESVAYSASLQSKWWFFAHAIAGVVAVLIAVTLTIGRRPPAKPVLWMRMNLVILLVAIFLATASNYVRLLVSQRAAEVGLQQVQLRQAP